MNPFKNLDEKPRTLRILIVTGIFLGMFIVALVGVQPLYKVLNNYLVQVKTLGTDYLRDNLGISVRYSSFSPSILTGLRIRQLEFFDIQTEEPLAKVESISLSYSLVELVRDRSISGVKSLTISGLELSCEDEEKLAVYQSLVSRFTGSPDAIAEETGSPAIPAAQSPVTGSEMTEQNQSPRSGKNPAEAEKSSKKEEKYSEKSILPQVNLSLPFPVTLRNTHIAFGNKSINCRLTLNQVILENSDTLPGQISAVIKGRVTADFAEPVLPGFKSAGIALNIQSVVAPSLDGSVCNATISFDRGNGFYVRPVKVSAQLADNVAGLVLLSDGQPFSLLARFDLASKKGGIQLDAKDFYPLEFVTFPADFLEQVPVVSDLKEFVMSGTYTGSADFGAEDFLASLEFGAKGSASVPDALLPGGASAQFDVSGSPSFVTATALALQCDIVDAAFSGDFNIKTLQPSGYLDIQRFPLPSGQVLATEIFLDRIKDGLTVDIPQIKVGQSDFRDFHADLVQQDKTLDFDLKLKDYSRTDADSHGNLEFSGSLFMEETLFVQLNAEINSMYTNSVIKAANLALPEENGIPQNVVDLLEPYVFSTDLYVSTNFSSVSFNSPYTLVASTVAGGEMLLVSFDGNETSVNVSQLVASVAGQSLEGTLNADFESDYSQAFFSTDLYFNQIPYSFSGVFEKDAYVLLTGDYGLNFSLNFGSEKGFWGDYSLHSLPVVFSDYIFSVSLGGSYDFYDLNEWFVQIGSLELSEESEKFRIKPHFAVSGRVDNYGYYMDSVSYGDIASVLNGVSSASWQIQNGTLSAASLNLSMQNQLSQEAVFLDLSCTNPLEKSFTDSDFLDNCYVTGTIATDDFLLSRFLLDQTQDNVLDADISVLGPISNPQVTLNVPSVNLKLGDNEAVLSGTFALEDKAVRCEELQGKFGNFSLNNAQAEFSIDGMEGSFSTVLNADMGKMAVNAPLSVKFNITPADRYSGGEPSIYAEATVTNFSVTSFPVVEKYRMTFERNPGVTFVTGGENDSLMVCFYDSGDFFASAYEEFPIHFNADGYFKNNQMDINVSNLEGDVKLLSDIVKTDIFGIENGKISGNLKLGGLATDPEFHGTITLSDAVFTSNMIESNRISIPSLNIVAEEYLLSIKESRILFGDATALLSGEVVLDRWIPDEVKVNLRTLKNSFIPAQMNVGILKLKSDIGLDVSMEYAADTVALRGQVKAENALAVLDLSISSSAEDDSIQVKVNQTEEPVQEQNPFANSMRFIMDMQVSVGQRSQMYFPTKENPVVRALVETTTPVRIVLDTQEEIFQLGGSVVLRGGEIIYLNRNFYIREGSISYPENSDPLNPRINLRAEIRERDSNGEVITISLAIPNQFMVNLEPVFSSSPPRSSEDINLLLGKAFLGDAAENSESAWGTIAATGIDFLLQSTLFRSIENQLRDLFKFDIFSFRTPFFQQAFLQLMSPESEEKELRLGNYFDNTTVYIGKYIGQSMYLDAMVRMVYNDKPVSGSIAGLVIQPEIGLELPSPFATIRWSLAPDVTSAQNLWVPYSSISLSWKFNF
ncbi:MAG: translocation/assembly module TamB domain-containing protein [Treponemataceae bacterium]|nr:translocation/assembly module TamB domain-containing protein [Treponemataceae bacterium]